MKKLLLISILSFSLCGFSFAQTYAWQDISTNMPEVANLTDVQFIGKEIWISGWGNGVFFSPDGGVTFKIQSIQLVCNANHMLNENKGHPGPHFCYLCM